MQIRQSTKKITFFIDSPNCVKTSAKDRGSMLLLEKWECPEAQRKDFQNLPLKRKNVPLQRKIKPYTKSLAINMKTRFLLTTLLFTYISVATWAQGITFLPEGATFQQAVEQAKSSKKKIFLDCYTSWCGPCKQMARNIFTQQVVGDFMNPSYVCIKIDMEKGEGPGLMQKLDVTAFPTFIIFNSEGKEIGRWVGGSNAETFIQKVKDNSKDTSTESMDLRFANGERDPQFLLEYINMLGASYKQKQCNIVAEALLDGKAETFASDAALSSVFMKHLQNPFHPAFVYTAKQPQALVAATSQAAVSAKLQNTWNSYSRTLIEEKDGAVSMDTEKFQAFVDLMEEYNVPNREQIRLTTLIGYAEKKQDWELYVSTLEEYWNSKDLDMNDLELCKFSTPVIQHCQDQKLRNAVKKMLQKRLKDLRSGKREPLRKIGNMTLAGSLDQAMERLIKEMD